MKNDINLLPPKEKEELKLENERRLIIILGNIFTISLVCLAFVLFALKFYILGEVALNKIVLEADEKKYQTQDFLFFEQMIQKYNSDIIKIDNFYKKEIYFKDVLRSVLEIERPDGIRLTSLSVNRESKDNNIKVAISGISDNRDNLISFKNNVEKSQKIKNINFPSENWVKSKDIIFHLNFDSNLLSQEK